MAIRYAVASGNWSSTATWNGGTLPTSADDVYANTFTVNIDQDITVLSLQTGTTTGVTVGGGFTCATSQTITATAAVGIRPGSVSACLTITAGTVNVNANIYGALSGTGFWGIVASGTGTINVIGSVNGASNGGGIDITSSSVSLNVTGAVIGGSGAFAGIRAVTTGAISITGNLTGGSGTGAYALGLATSVPSLVTVTGNITGGASSTGNGINCSVTTTINITGTITSAVAAAVQLTAGAVNSVGAINASNGLPGIYHSGNLVSSIVTVTGPLNSSTSGFSFPVWAARLRIKTGQTNSWLAWRDDTGVNGNEVRWNTSDISGGNPSAANVRLGTIFGKSNEFTGSLAVPSPASVAAGVAVDNTVGTAAVKLEDIAAVTGAQIVAALSRS